MASIAAPPVAPIALPKITLTDITTILGRRIVFITVTGTKPGQGPESFILAEGQGINEVEVRNIDEKAGVVTVINHGELQVLDFERSGAKPSSVPQGPVSTEAMFPRPASPSSLRKNVPLSAEEQVALIEVQRVKYQQENDPVRAILPPTEMAPETSENK